MSSCSRLLPYFFGTPLHAEHRRAVDAAGLYRAAFDQQVLDAVALRVLHLEVHVQPAAALDESAHLAVGVGGIGTFQVGFEHRPQLFAGHFHRRYRRVCRHDVPQLLHRHVAGKDRRAVAPAVRESQPGAGGTGDRVEQHVVHRRLERCRAVQRRLRPTHHLVEEVAVRVDRFGHPRSAAPQRRKHWRAVGGALAGAVGAVAQRAVLRIYLLAAAVVGGLRRLVDRRVAAAGQLRIDRRALRQPVRIALQRHQFLRPQRRCTAVHACIRSSPAAARRSCLRCGSCCGRRGS